MKRRRRLFLSATAATTCDNVALKCKNAAQPMSGGICIVEPAGIETAALGGLLGVFRAGAVGAFFRPRRLSGLVVSTLSRLCSVVKLSALVSLGLVIQG